MFNKIIVGVDGRQGGRDALALAARLASLFGGELVAVHAYPYDLFISRGTTPDFETIMHGNAEDPLTDELERAHVVAHAAADARRLARPRAAPGRQAPPRRPHRRRLGAPRHHRPRAGRRRDHGDPARRRVPRHRGAARLRRSRPALKTIGVGFDGSPESRAAAELARDLATAAGARLKVIRVLEPPPPGGPTLGYDADWAQRAEERRDEAQAELDAVLAELGEIATGEVVVGDPATELAYAGNDLDLLVTGSRGYGPVRRLMLGSTSTRLVREAPCPVLVTRGAEADAERRGRRAGERDGDHRLAR